LGFERHIDGDRRGVHGEHGDSNGARHRDGSVGVVDLYCCLCVLLLMCECVCIRGAANKESEREREGY
jgi:hypothetical protein